MRKNVVAGMGEVGRPLLKLISKQHAAAGYDIDPKLADSRQLDRYKNLQTGILHICIPFSEKFESDVVELFGRFKPQLIVIHSTVSPNTTAKLQKRLPVPVLYSATRGVHSRMSRDLKRYTKYFALEQDAPRARWASLTFTKLMNKCGIKTAKMSKPVTLELAKIIVDTSYYGWLINYSQLSKIIADKHGVEYDEMWKFADEIHKHLGNRPKMHPGFIGGHCLDAGEMLFIRTAMGMRPITIKSYVENNCQSNVLSYDTVKKVPCFEEVTLRWGRRFSGTMITLTSDTNRSITATDEHVMIESDSLSEKIARDVKIGDHIPFIASLPSAGTKTFLNFKSRQEFRHGMPELTFTAEFCRLLGHYTSKGTIKKYGRECRIELVFGKGEEKYVADVCNILDSLGLEYAITQDNGVHVGIESTPFALFVSDTLGCGTDAASKCLPEFIYFAPREQKEQFVNGHIGSALPSHHMRNGATPELAAGMDMLLLSMGHVMACEDFDSSHARIQAGNGMLLHSLPASAVHGKHSQMSSITEMPHAKNFCHVPGKNLFMIKTVKITVAKKVQNVYSIDTKNHLFVSTWGRLVHNCVIPNLDLVGEEQLYQIDRINNMFVKKTGSEQGMDDMPK